MFSVRGTMVTAKSKLKIVLNLGGGEGLIEGGCNFTASLPPVGFPLITQKP